jgi:maintenance of morphology protein 1
MDRMVDLTAPLPPPVPQTTSYALIPLHHSPIPPTNPRRLSFTQGFLLGQLSIALIIFCFIKFFIFGEPPSDDDRALNLSSLRRARTLAHKNSLHHLRPRANSTTSNALRHKSSRTIIRNPVSTGGPSIATILAKTYYNVKGHQPESLDWFNVLVAQTIAQLRADARQDDAILTSLNDILNGGVKPGWIGEIRVTEIALGDEFPIFSNCRVMPAEEGFGHGGLSGGGSGVEEGTLQARMDVDLSDVITLGIETTLVLNYPKPFVAVLPVALAVSVVRFSGTLAVSFIPSSSPPSTSTNSRSPTPGAHSHSRSRSRPRSEHPEPPRPTSPSSANDSTPTRPTTLAFTFLDDYRLDLSVRSLVGSRSRLQDVPKIAQLIESRVHAWFDERVVEPRFQQIVLPSLWPRKRNTRGGEDEVEIDEEAIIDDEEEAPASPETEVEPDVSIAIESPTPVKPRTRPAPYMLPRTPPPTSIEARLEAEGAKMREAEIRAGERRRDGEGVRRRGERPPLQSRDQSRRSNFGGDWSGQRERGLPGTMPGG